MNIFLLPIVILIIKFLLEAKIIISPSPTPVPTPTPVAVRRIVTPVDDGQPWGVAKQLDEYTWKIKVGQDEKMATSNEVFLALNEYRRRYGASALNWDEKLASYAKSRAVYFNKIKNLDGHKGFVDFMNNQDGFNKLGFNQLGENASIGYQLSGLHLIEWIYAGDEPHNKNQLNNIWGYVGIGVDGTATTLIFGTGRF